jgi:hypothetical protein
MACPRGQQLETIDNRFCATMLRLQVGAPLVTKKVQAFFTTLPFGFQNLHLLMEGINPFLFPPLSPAQKAEEGNVTLDLV